MDPAPAEDVEVLLADAREIDPGRTAGSDRPDPAEAGAYKGDAIAYDTSCSPPARGARVLRPS